MTTLITPLLVESKSESAAHSQPAPPVIKKAIKEDGNTFNIVRLVAALMVIFSHCFPLLAKPDRTGYGEWQGPLAVWIFFVISGFLITGSYKHTGNIAIFVGSRILRVWPALIAVTLISVFVIGPAVTTCSLPAYFANPATFNYLQNIQLLYIHYPLPGVFEHNLYPGAVNGSIWSIPLEILMYLVTCILGVSGLLRRRYLALAAWTVLFISGLPNIGSPNIDKLQPIAWLGTLATIKYPVLCYLTGTLLYLFKEQIRPSIRLSVLLLVAAALFAKIDLYTASIVLLPLGILTFALRPTKINLFSKLGDYSYGIYLWAFPVQQLLVHFYPRLSFWQLFIFASVLSIGCGAISWYVVEKPCLAFKKKLPKLYAMWAAD